MGLSEICQETLLSRLFTYFCKKCLGLQSAQHQRPRGTGIPLTRPYRSMIFSSATFWNLALRIPQILTGAAQEDG